MKLRAVLFASAATLAANGQAQSTISAPLPPARSSSGIATPIVTRVENAEQAATTSIAIPIGKYGRPDINPYDRAVDMTVPMTFQARTLGDIEVTLTADDRLVIDGPGFLNLIESMLNAPAFDRVVAALHSRARFEPSALAGTGIALTYDPSSLALVVNDIPPELRSIERLFAPPRDDLDLVDLSPAKVSAYLNLNALASYFWELDGLSKPALNMDGAVRVGRFVFEGDFQLGERFSLDEESYGFTRNYARLVYDQPELYRRWIVGDLDPETRGQQSFVRMGGIGVIRQRRKFNAFRAAILQSNRQLVIQRSSTVRFLRNGSLFRQLRLDPGSYDFSALPLIAGSNDIQIEVTDNSGQTQFLNYQQYLDPIDLDPGDFEYGAYFGPTSSTIGTAPDYQGEITFTGFFRKAFLNRPAIGVGLQLSSNVQSATGQTQFVLGNGGRILIDGGLSHGRDAGVGFASGVAYDHFFDRGGLTDSLLLRADHYSNKYATLGNEEGFNGVATTLSGQYTRQLTLRTLLLVSGSYQINRDRANSYRVAANGYHRLTDRLTFRAGVDYFNGGSTFANTDGVGFTVGLVFQPDFRRRAEARYESRTNLGELSYNQSGLNELESVGFGGVVAYEDRAARAQAYLDYSANRFDAGVSHATFGPSLGRFADSNVSTVRFGTSLAYADGLIGVGRRINDSFALLVPHRNLGSRRVVAGQSLAENDFIGKSGPLGAAVNNFLTSYVNQSIQYDVEDPPAGYDIGAGVIRVRPPYRSGYALRIGTDAFVSAVGTLVRGEKPVSLAGGRVTLLDLKPGDSPKPIPFFTNSVGRFAIAELLPGRRYLVETYGAQGTIDRSFIFTVPADNQGLFDLGQVQPGSVR